jgi:hypothetical protein
VQGGSAFATDGATGLLVSENGALCTGTLIAPDVVLTAAHCLDSPIKTFSTGAGAPTRTRGIPDGMTTYEVAETLAHPTFEGVAWGMAIGADVALVRLAHPPEVAPAELATEPPAVGTVCHAVGYGRHTQNGIETFSEKRIATVRVVAVDEGRLSVTAVDGIADGGDSGGPLSCGDGRIHGTVSTGGVVPEHIEASLVLYMRSDVVKPWIESTLAAWQ